MARALSKISRRTSDDDGFSLARGKLKLDDITPLILTYNEEANLGRTLAALSWARQIVVVDSGSTDATREIALRSDRVRFVERDLDCHANQWNFGLAHIETPWTLAFDADYVAGDGMAHEIESLDSEPDAFAANFVYAIDGKPLRGTLYPPRVVLFRTDRFQYRQDGHTQLLELSGAEFGLLQTKIMHDDRKPLMRWLRSQHFYAVLEAEKLLTADRSRLGWKDRLRRGIIWAPPLTLLYCLFYKNLILDGWPGVYYALQRTYAELLLSLELLDRRLRGPLAQRKRIESPTRQSHEPTGAESGISLEHTRD
jgi:glycosyltransferase involved in cell wall biosynthesis